MGLKHYTQHTFEISDYVLPIPWEFIDGSELFKISDDGMSCVLGSLTQDDSPSDPIKAWDNGELVIFGRDGNRRPDIESWKRLIRSNAGFIAPVDYSGYGSRTSCGQVLTAKDTKGDKRTGENSNAERVLDSMDGYYTIPDDATDPQGYANNTMEMLEQYYNGDVYGVCVWTYTRDYAEYDLNGAGVPGEFTAWEEPDRDQECWGFYGYEYAAQELQEQFDATDFTKTDFTKRELRK